MNLKRFFRKFAHLTRAIIDDVTIETSEEGSEVVARGRPAWRKPRCGGCGRGAVRLHGQRPKERTWRHLGVFGAPVWIRCPVFRVLCSRCGVRTMAIPWARLGSVFTRAFEDEVAWFVQRTNKTATSEYFKISWVTVGNVAHRVVEEKLDRSLLKDLHAIGVDEIFYGRPKKFLTVVANLLTGQVIWSGEGQSAATLGRFFDEIGAEERANIQFVAMDMDSAFEKAVRECVPHAEIVYDCFHVVQLLNDAIDEVRRELMRELSEDPDLKRLVQGSRWPLLKNPWNLTRREKEKLSAIARSNLPIYRAYLLKEAFQSLFRSASLADVDKLFKEWYGWARRSQLNPMRRAAATIKERWSGVRRYIELGFTNALVEGFNNKIRLLSHRAFGFHSSAALIAMIHLCCSGITLEPLGW